MSVCVCDSLIFDLTDENNKITEIYKKNWHKFRKRFVYVECVSVCVSRASFYGDNFESGTRSISLNAKMKTGEIPVCACA